MLTVPEALEVASSESEAQDDGDLLCDGQGEALGDGVPVREGARLPLGSPLEDRSEVLLTLTLVQPLTEPLFDAAKLTELVAKDKDKGMQKGLSQFLDDKSYRPGFESLKN